MFKKPIFLFAVCFLSFLSCDDSDTEFPDRFNETLFDKTWIASNGTNSLRYRLNSDGTYNGGNDEGFPNQGTWNWVGETEEVMRINYGSTTLWYRFADLTSNSVVTFISETQPYDWGPGILFTLSN